LKVFYDPVTKGFYKSGWNVNIPTSSVEITEDQRLFLIQEQEVGNKVVVKEGVVVSAPPSTPSHEALIDSERKWRDSELINADIELNKVQDSDPKAIGTVSDWRTYRKALRAWPENKNFPKQEFRPKSPASKE
jgi:hypothetical protein